MSARRIDGSYTIVGRAGRFVHALKGMLHAHSPPDEEVVVKETDNLAKREGFPRGGGKSTKCFTGGKGVGGRAEKGCFPEAEAEHMMLGKGEEGEEVLSGVIQLVGRAGGFVYNLKGMLLSPLDEEVR